MRKSHTIPMGVALLFATQNLTAQTRQQDELTRQANNLFSADMDIFLAWFTDTSTSNLLFLLMGLSFLYFLSMLSLFILVTQQVFSIKEHSLLAILLEDWLTEKEKILLPTTTKIELEETKSKNILEETAIQLDVPNLEVLGMKKESTQKRCLLKLYFTTLISISSSLHILCL